MTITPVFIYGTLKSERVRYAVLGDLARSISLMPARLDGFDVRYVEGTRYPMVVRSATAHIQSYVMTGLCSDALKLLDRFEGVHYSRNNVEVHMAKGNISAEVYLPDNTLIPAGKWSYDEWVQWDMEDFFKTDYSAHGVRPPAHVTGKEE